MFFFPFTNIKKLSDDVLLKQFRKSHDNKVAEVLVDRYFYLVLGNCLKYLKDKDLSREASFRVFEKLFEKSKTENIENLSAWLHVVSKNYCLNELRQQKQFEPIDWHQNKEEELYNDEADLKLEISLTQLKLGLKELKEEQKKCVELFYLESKSYKEIEAITGLNYNEVKSNIQNGKRALAIYLRKNGIEKV